MIRIFIVLPVYLACMFWLPQAAAYQTFHAAVLERGVLSWDVIAYGVALAVGIVGTAIIEFGVRPEGFGFDSALRVLRMGLIGLILMGAYQLFAYYTSRELSIFMLVVPAVFMVAETAYELVEYAIYRIRYHRGPWRR